MADRFDEQAHRIFEAGGSSAKRYGALLRQADANARALIAPAQAGGEAADYTDAEIDECGRAAWAALRKVAAGFASFNDSRQECPFCSAAALLNGTVDDATEIATWGESEDGELFVRTVRAEAASILARRKPAPTSDERPMLTEWREIAGDWYRHGPPREGSDEPSVILHCNPVGGGLWAWRVYRAGWRVLADRAPDLKSAKRAADEAAAKWYRLPAPVPVPCEVRHVAGTTCRNCHAFAPGDAPVQHAADCALHRPVPGDAAALREAAPDFYAEAKALRDEVRELYEGGGMPMEVTALLRRAFVSAYERGRADAAKARPTNAPPATVAEAVAWLDDVLQWAGTRPDVRDGLTKVRALLAAKTREEPAPLDEATRMEIAQRLTLAMHIYAGHKIDSRGPTGCIYEALQLAAPAVAADLDETMDYGATYARFWEDGQLRPGKRSGAEAVPSPREEAPAGVLATFAANIMRSDTEWTYAYIGEPGAGARLAVDPSSVEAGQRVTVAVLTGSVAGIVEAHRALTAYLDHLPKCGRGCMWTKEHGPDARHDCQPGQILAAAVGGAQ